MKIESIIHRDEGTVVVLGGVEYHFKPDDKGRHVATVDEPAHVDRFLEIAEGYRAIDDGGAAAEEKARQQAEAEALAVAELERARIAAEAAAAEEAARREFEQAAEQERLAVEEQARQKAEAERVAAEERAKDEAPPAAVVATEEMTREQLVALYETKFGEKPHPRSGIKTLVDRING